MHHAHQDRQAQQELAQPHRGLGEQQLEVAKGSLARQHDEQGQADDDRRDRKEGVEQ